MTSTNPMPSAPSWNPAAHDAQRASGASGPANIEASMAQAPSGLRCQLTQAPLEDAVLAEDGYTYNRPAWQAHVQAHPRVLLSPVTHQLVSPGVVPNRHLKNIVAEWRAWHAAQPPHAQPFDMEGWVEDFVTKEVMREPVALPDGMVCDKETARLHIFKHPQHPGRSMLDQRVTFDPQQKMLRDLNVLQLSEAVLGYEPGTLSRVYVLPSIASMLPRTTPSMAAVGGGAFVGAVGGGVQPPAAPGPAALAVQAPNPHNPRPNCARGVWLGLIAGAAVAPLIVGLAAECGVFDAAIGANRGKSLGVFLLFLTAPWAAAMFAITSSAGCLDQRRNRPRRAAAAPVGAAAV